MVVRGAVGTESTHDVASLRVSRPGRIDPAAVCAALAGPDWLGERVDDPSLPAGSARYMTDLVLPLPPDGRLLSLRKAAIVDVGRTRRLPSGCETPIEWHSATLAPLFPVFAGRIVVRAASIAIEGSYAPPGGAIGMAADRVMLNVAARGTARWLLDHIVARASGALPDEGALPEDGVATG